MDRHSSEDDSNSGPNARGNSRDWDSRQDRVDDDSESFTSRRRKFSKSQSPVDQQDLHDRRAHKNEDRNPGNNLFITGLAPDTKEKDLESIFSKYGKIEKVSVMYDPHTMVSRGFAFVTFQDVQDAEAALSECSRGLELHGKTLIVDKARRSRARTPTPGVYRGPPKRDSRRSDDYHQYGRSSTDAGVSRYDHRSRRYDRYYDSRRTHYRENSDGARCDNYYDYRSTRRPRKRSPY